MEGSCRETDRRWCWSVETAKKLSSANDSVGEDSPSDQKRPQSVIAKPGLRRFQTRPAQPMKRVYRSTPPLAKLELVAGPQCPVIEVAAWLTLFDKLAARRKLRSRLETTADDSLASAPPC